MKNKNNYLAACWLLEDGKNYERSIAHFTAADNKKILLIKNTQKMDPKFCEGIVLGFSFNIRYLSGVLVNLNVFLHLPFWLSELMKH